MEFNTKQANTYYSALRVSMDRANDHHSSIVDGRVQLGVRGEVVCACACAQCEDASTPWCFCAGFFDHKSPYVMSLTTPAMSWSSLPAFASPCVRAGAAGPWKNS
jgi:hypothetical protein